MSLINEALKKAQRQRNEEAQSLPPMPGGGPAPRRGRSGSNNTLLIGAGAFGLVVISVVATVFLVNRPVSKPPTVASATPAAPRAASVPANNAAPAPIVLAPVLKPAQPEIADKPAVAAPAPAIADSKKSAPATITDNTRPTPAAASVATPPPKPAADAPVSSTAAADPMATVAKGDERVHAFVDAVRVTAIRPVGNESRVLMNERVYRVNDIVERNLGVKLIKVETDHLTFADPNGVTYVKYF
jgi:hypothetical protein